MFQTRRNVLRRKLFDPSQFNDCERSSSSCIIACRILKTQTYPKKRMEPEPKEEKDIYFYKNEVKKEKAGKRKIFLSLIKLAQELKRVRKQTAGLEENAQYQNQTWYEGGLWRAPRVLPEIKRNVTLTERTRSRTAISLSDMFLNLVIVTGFTRVGMAMNDKSSVELSHVLYFAVFWTIWSRETSYTTRFDTRDLSAQFETLCASLAVLFGSLSVSLPMNSDGAIRIMVMAAFCCTMHLCLMVRVLCWYKGAETSSVEYHVKQYALFNIIMNLTETITWVVGILFVSPTYRWIIFLVGVILALRIPRSILSDDFHAANSQRGVLFILLLGFLLQSVVVVATDFFKYDNPDFKQCSFIGGTCLLLFCIKLLYCDDANTLASDHALLVNRTAAAFFNIGHFALLFSITILGSGLNLLTHSYLAATAALPGRTKNLVLNGFSAVLLSTMFIKSMHIKRVPLLPAQRMLFVGAYTVQALATIAVAGISFFLSYGKGGYLLILLQNDLILILFLTGSAVLLVFLSMLDEGLELALQSDGEGSPFLVSPFGLWWCLHPDVTPDEILAEEAAASLSHNTFASKSRTRTSNVRLSEFTPLLGESVAQLKLSTVDLGHV